MCKKILSLVLSLILVIGVAVPGYAADPTTPTSVTITFDPNGGTVELDGQRTPSKVNKNITLGNNTDFNTTYTELNPQREGYTHRGWEMDKILIGSSTLVDAKHDGKTFIAQWEANEITISFNLNYQPNGPAHPGDTAPTKSDAKVKYDSAFGSAADAPDSTMIPKGYTFEGWFDNASGGTEIKKTDVCKNTTALTFYAHWLPIKSRVTTSYEYPEGAVLTASPVPAAPSFDVEYNGTYSSLTTPIPSAVPLGYVFDKWTTSKDNTGSEVTAATKVISLEAHTLYAKWEKTHYVVTLDYGVVPQATDAPVHLLYATPVPDTTTTPPVTDAPAGRAAGDAPESPTPEPKHPNYSDGDSFGSDGPLPSPTATGYTFLGWAKTAKLTDGVNVVAADTPVVGSTDEVKDDHTLYAKWQASKHTVTFNLNYTPAPSATPAPVQADYGTKLAGLLPSPDPTRTGYHFLGWFIHSGTNGENQVQITNTSATRVQGDVTLHAHWISANTVQLELNGGTLPSGTTNSVVVSEGNPWPKLPDPTRAGYQFEGWYTSNTEGTQVSGGAGEVTSPIPTTLYARWTAKKFQVKFDYNGGSGKQEPRSYTFGEKYSRVPSDAQWAGHGFLGWYTEASGGTQITGETVMSTASDHTLYAHWGFQVSFDPGVGFGDMENDMAIVGEDYVLPECGFTPPEGMSFYRWAIGTVRGEQFPAGTRYTIPRNTTLYAIWREAPVYVTASSTEGGSLSSDIGGSGKLTLDRGSDVTFIPRANQGYLLKDLVIDGESCGPMKSYTFQNMTEDHTIHAVFESTPAPTYSTCDHGLNCPLSNFSDLKPDAWYHDAVHYCMERVLMNGTGSGQYSPSAKADRATLVTVLWQAAGCPYSPTTGTLSQPFLDVSSRAWYYKPVCWALQNGITSGYSNGCFGPNDKITREQVVTMLWQYAGKPGNSITRMPYLDTWAVSDYAWNAMLWATENNIISGKERNLLDPKGLASRTEIAQIMMAYMKYIGEA